jgi:hypothetical protein
MLYNLVDDVGVAELKCLKISVIKPLTRVKLPGWFSTSSHSFL